MEKDSTMAEQLLTHDVTWHIDYRIHLGETWSRFFHGLVAGEIRATVCTSCDRTFVPPQSFCEHCFEPVEKWTTVSTKGTLQVATIVYRGFEGGPRRNVDDQRDDALGARGVAGIQQAEADAVGCVLDRDTHGRADRERHRGEDIDDGIGKREPCPAVGQELQHLRVDHLARGNAGRGCAELRGECDGTRRNDVHGAILATVDLEATVGTPPKPIVNELSRPATGTSHS